MEEIYYVAILFEHARPTIVEEFTSKRRAEVYAKIMTEEKGRQYIVLTLAK